MEKVIRLRGDKSTDKQTWAKRTALSPELETPEEGRESSKCNATATAV